MKFSSQGENYIKEFFTVKNKESIIDEIDKTISKMEKGIMNFLRADYSQLIDECSSLEDLKETMADIRMVNRDVSKISNELYFDLMENITNETELDQSTDRIAVIKRELKTIDSYLEHTLEVASLLKELTEDQSSEITDSGTDIEEDKYLDFNSHYEDSEPIAPKPRKYNLYEDRRFDSTNCYKIMLNLQEMEEMLSSLTKYYFHGGLFKKYQILKENYKEVLLREIGKFLEKDWQRVGKNTAISRSFFIFDEILRFNFVSSKDLTVFFTANKMGFEEEVTELVNSTRKEQLIEKRMKCSSDQPKEVNKRPVEERDTVIDRDDTTKGGSITRVNNNAVHGSDTTKGGSIASATSNAVHGSDTTKGGSIARVNNKNDDSVYNPPHEPPIIKSDDYVTFCIGNILLTAALSRHFPEIHSFHDEMFADLSTLKVFDPLNISRLRIVADKMKVSSTFFISVIENLVFNYFDGCFKQPDILNYTKQTISKNARKCLFFLPKINQFEGEFDSLLIKKIDEAFVFLINNSPNCQFFERIDEITEIYENDMLRGGDDVFDRCGDQKGFVDAGASTSATCTPLVDPPVNTSPADQMTPGNASASMTPSTSPVNTSQCTPQNGKDPRNIFKNVQFDFLNEIDRSLGRMAKKEIADLVKFSKNRKTEEIVRKVIEMAKSGNEKYRRRLADIFMAEGPGAFADLPEDDRAVILDAARRNIQ